jgi:hypothetical protein
MIGIQCEVSRIFDDRKCSAEAICRLIDEADRGKDFKLCGDCANLVRSSYSPVFGPGQFELAYDLKSNAAEVRR